MTHDSVYWASELTRLARQRAAVARERHEAIEAAARTDNAKPPASFWSALPSPDVVAAYRLSQRAAFDEKIAACEEKLARNQAEDRRAREQLTRAARSEDEAVYALEEANYARRRPLMGQGLAITEDDYRRALNAVPAWVVALFAGVVLALTVLRTTDTGSTALDAISQIATISVAVASLGVAIYGVRVQQRPLTVQLQPNAEGAATGNRIGVPDDPGFPDDPASANDPASADGPGPTEDPCPTDDSKLA